MRVRNAHPAMVEGIPSGAEGDVDASRHGVQGFLRVGMLVAVLDDAEAAEVIARSPVDDAVRGVDTLVGAQARVRTLEAELNAIDGRFGERWEARERELAEREAATRTECARRLAAQAEEHAAAIDAASRETRKLRDELDTLRARFEERGAALSAAEINKLRATSPELATSPDPTDPAPRRAAPVRRNG